MLSLMILAMVAPLNPTLARSSFSQYRALNLVARELITEICIRYRTPGTKTGPPRCSGQTSRRIALTRRLAMWTSLFAVTALIAVALSMAAIVVDSANGGKFRL